MGSCFVTFNVKQHRNNKHSIGIASECTKQRRNSIGMLEIVSHSVGIPKIASECQKKRGIRVGMPVGISSIASDWHRNAKNRFGLASDSVRLDWIRVDQCRMFQSTLLPPIPHPTSSPIAQYPTQRMGISRFEQMLRLYRIQFSMHFRTFSTYVLFRPIFNLKLLLQTYNLLLISLALFKFYKLFWWISKGQLCRPAILDIFKQQFLFLPCLW